MADKSLNRTELVAKHGVAEIVKTRVRVPLLAVGIGLAATAATALVVTKLVGDDSAVSVSNKLADGSTFITKGDAKVTVLSEMIKHDVNEEEKRDGLFAKSRQSEMDLEALGEQLASRKADKRMVGFWLMVVSNLMWILWGWHDEAWALVALQVGLMALNVRGIVKNEHETAS